MKTKHNLLDFTKEFDTDLKCRKYLETKLWKDGKPICPHCAVIDEAYRFADGRRFKCKACKKQFTITVGTIFEGSHVQLQKWFVAVFLLSGHRKGISSLQLSRDLAITQKSAWYMLHRLRHAIRTQSFLEPLKKTVEMDETYVGGKEQNKHMNKRIPKSAGGHTKTIVFGMLERETNQVRTQVIDGTTKRSLFPVIGENVSRSAVVMTDEGAVYMGLDKHYIHSTVNHRDKEYVRGIVHTNGIENFWSIFKRGIIGIYHQVSPKHIDKYLDEFEFRYSTHKDTDKNRIDSMLGKTDGYLSYKELIQKK